MRGDGVTQIIRWGMVVGIGLGIVLVGCGTNDKPAVETTPTRTLVPPTVTPTAEPVALTPTPTDLPAPASLSGAESAETGTPSSPVQVWIDRAVGDLVANHDAAPADIRLLGVETFNWEDAALGCAARRDLAPPLPEPRSGYRLVLNVGSRIYVYHTDGAETFFLCEDRYWLAQEGVPVLLDPIAADMAALIAQDIARRADVPENRVRLTGLLTVNWPDSSVGCPKPGGDYADDPTPGYRMVFRVDGERFIYHTSSRDFVRCAPDEEILPGMLRRALPSTSR